jgi:hypothetical protein
MKRYVKAILGGVLAVLAAVGWTAGIAFLAMLKGDTIIGIEINKGGWYLLVPLLAIFSIGFFFAFRAAYSKISN